MTTTHPDLCRWVVAGCLSAMILVGAGCRGESEYRRFESPDGGYSVIVFRHSSVFSRAMPGQSSDAPGTVRLYDKQGHTLQSTDVEMVQLIETVEWEADSVHIKLLADWPLPK